jgi:hypothetical protein
MESNKEAAIEFVRGVVFVLLVMGVFFGFILTLGKSDPKPAEKFAVVDNYSGCAVIKYTPPNRAESVYFLDCQHYRD